MLGDRGDIQCEQLLNSKTRPLYHKPDVLTIKLAFHGADTDNNSDTDTDILADFRTRIVARMWAFPATSLFSLPREYITSFSMNTHEDPRRLVRRLVRHAQFSSRGSSRGCPCIVQDKLSCTRLQNKKHLKNTGPIRHCEPPHALILHCHSPGVATVARRLRIAVHDDNDNNDNA